MMRCPGATISVVLFAEKCSAWKMETANLNWKAEMAKSHRHNHKARRKRGGIAFAKKAKRRSGRGVTGGWRVTFSCGTEEFIPLANSKEVGKVARIQHATCVTPQCDEGGCNPVVLKPLS